MLNLYIHHIWGAAHVEMIFFFKDELSHSRTLQAKSRAGVRVSFKVSGVKTVTYFIFCAEPFRFVSNLLGGRGLRQPNRNLTTYRQRECHISEAR